MTNLETLKAQVADLGAALLPQETQVADPLSLLSSVERSRAKAYVVLAHAEVEEYIEGRFDAYVQGEFEAPDGWSDTLLYLTLSMATKLTAQRRRHGSASSVAWAAVEIYRSDCLSANHGIQQKYIEKLARPLGLEARVGAERCSQLMAALDTLGSRRGSFAHRTGLVQDVLPGDAREVVSRVLENMHELEHVFPGAGAE